MIPNIDLLPSSVEKETKNTLSSVLFIIGVGLLLLLLLLYIVILHRDIQKLDAQVNQLELDKEELEVMVSQWTSDSTIEQVVEFAQYVSYPVTPMIDEIQKAYPASTIFTSYQFNEKNVMAVARFETLDETATHVSNLLSGDVFSDVKINRITTNEIGASEEERQAFTVLPQYEMEIELDIFPSYLIQRKEQE